MVCQVNVIVTLLLRVTGNVYPCDFYCTDEWKLGTIDDFNDLIKSDKAKNFASCSLPINDKCKKCKYLYLCRGGCRRWREPFINGNRH